MSVVQNVRYSSWMPVSLHDYTCTYMTPTYLRQRLCMRRCKRDVRYAHLVVRDTFLNTSTASQIGFPTTLSEIYTCVRCTGHFTRLQSTGFRLLAEIPLSGTCFSMLVKLGGKLCCIQYLLSRLQVSAIIHIARMAETSRPTCSLFLVAGAAKLTHMETHLQSETPTHSSTSTMTSYFCVCFML